MDIMQILQLLSFERLVFFCMLNNILLLSCKCTCFRWKCNFVADKDISIQDEKGKSFRCMRSQFSAVKNINLYGMIHIRNKLNIVTTRVLRYFARHLHMFLLAIQIRFFAILSSRVKLGPQVFQFLQISYITIIKSKSSEVIGSSTIYPKIDYK